MGCSAEVISILIGSLYPLKVIGDTLNTIMQYGAGPTTVQIDYRVTLTRSFTKCRYYY